MTLQIFSAKASDERAAEDGEVLGEDEHLPAEDRSVAGDDRVAPRSALHHSEIGIPVADEAVELDEAAGVEQLLEPLAGEELAALALPLDRLRVALVRRLVAQRRGVLELPLGRLLRLVSRSGHAQRLFSPAGGCAQGGSAPSRGVRPRGQTP